MEYVLVKRDEFRTFLSKDVKAVRLMVRQQAKRNPSLKPLAELDLFLMEVKQPGEVYDGFFVRWDDGVEDYMPRLNQLDAYLKAILSGGAFPRDIGSPTVYGLRRRGVKALLTDARLD